MIVKRIAFALILTLVLCQVALADRILLSTGEELVGEIVEETAEGVTIKTETETRFVSHADIEKIERSEKQAPVPAAPKIKCPVCAGRKAVECIVCGGTKKEAGACPVCLGSKGDKCPKCDGEKKMKCPKCGGSGKMKVWVIGQGMTTGRCDGCNGHCEVKCGKCKGKGTIDCKKCKGEGTGPCSFCGERGFLKCPWCAGEGVTGRPEVFQKVSYPELMRQLSDPSLTEIQKADAWEHFKGKTVFWHAIVSNADQKDGVCYIHLCMLPEDVTERADLNGISRKFYMGRLFAMLLASENTRVAALGKGDRVWVAGRIDGESPAAMRLADCLFFEARSPSSGNR